MHTDPDVFGTCSTEREIGLGSGTWSVGKSHVNVRVGRDESAKESESCRSQSTGYRGLMTTSIWRACELSLNHNITISYGALVSLA